MEVSHVVVNVLESSPKNQADVSHVDGNLNLRCYHMLLSLLQKDVFMASHGTSIVQAIILSPHHCSRLGCLLSLVVVMILIAVFRIEITIHLVCLNASFGSIHLCSVQLIFTEWPLVIIFGEHILMLLLVRRLLRLINIIILVNKLELFVLTRLVDIYDMLLSLLHDDLSHILHVSTL
jgi:hypothetical protein